MLRLHTRGYLEKWLVRLVQERSHSGLVRRFAKPLKGKPFRGFDSHPLRHRGVAQLVEHSSPKRVVAGSIPVSPAKLLNVQGSGVFILLLGSGTKKLDMVDSEGQAVLTRGAFKRERVILLK